METKKKIVIVEDNDLYRAALKALIDAQAHLEVVAETANGGEALKIVKQFPADLVLLDLRLPGNSGYDLLPELSQNTEAKILVLTILESEHNIRTAFEAGADGYCFKDVSSEELINAISSVLAGERYLSRPASSYPGERRAEQRQACECSIVWAYFNRDNLVSAKMVNCSRAGCYFETSQSITTGSTVLIRLEKPVAGSEKTVSGPVRSSAVAEVKWCDRRNRQYGVGVRYHFSG
jgi:CheY-like chemotaxis protein